MMLAGLHAGLLEWSLNAFWLLLSVTAACHAHRHRAPRSNLRQLATALVALACAATVLFPSISVSDDLYAQQWAIADSRTIAKKYEHPIGSVQTPQPLAPGPPLPNATRPTPQPTRVLPAAKVATSQQTIAPTAQRAPPPAQFL
jgi:hypothetical protein